MTTGKDRTYRVERFTAAILAGGRGIRLGMNKARLKIGGKLVLDHTTDCLREMFPEIIVILQAGDRAERAIGLADVRVVTDVLPSDGPLVGIYTALAHLSTPYVFVMACDMPYPNMELVRLLLSEAEGREVVVPRMRDHLEPLFAVYSRDLLNKVRAFLDQGRLKIPDLIEELDVRYVEEDEVAACDPEFRSFFNINTIEDLESAQTI